MVRFKFFVFVLLVLGLGVAHLSLVSVPLSARAVEGASAPATAAIAELARALDARRSAVRELALSLAGNPDVAAAVQPQVETLPKGKGIRIVEPPVGERFSALRAVLGEHVPEPLKSSWVLGLVTPDGALYSRGGGEPVSDDEFDPRPLREVGSAGKEVDAFGAPHVFYAVPVLWSPDGGRAQVAATLVVGAPLLDKRFLDAATLSSHVAALAVLKGGQVLESTGAQKELAAEALKALSAGQSDSVVARGDVRALLPQLSRVRLPLLTESSDTLGGQAPLAVGSRQSLGGDWEAVAVTSLRPFMSSLADYQQTALFALLGLFGFSLLWTLVMGMGSSKPAAKAAPALAAPVAAPPAVAASPAVPVFVPPAPEPPSARPEDFPFPPAPAVRASAPAPTPETPFDSPAMPFPPVAAAADADPFASNPPASEPRSDPAAAPASTYASSAPVPSTADLYPFTSPEVPRDPFGSPTVPGQNPFGMVTAPGQNPFGMVTAPGKDPFASLGGTALPFPSAEPGADAPAAARRGASFEYEDHPTAAYSLQQAADPFAAATAQARLQNGDRSDDSPEPTRVAAIPQDLLARTARPTTGEVHLPLPSPPAANPGVASHSPFAPARPTSAGVTSPFGSTAPAMSPAMAEEQHFQEVFREFVQTRDQCGEPQDGLTYDKFVAKLRKNREQLVQKYACKTVRFQVYVKEGKAALKATPVKD